METLTIVLMSLLLLTIIIEALLVVSTIYTTAEDL